ncbi:hypothetical protein [Stieleria mannarensis]|uniref:hypothetical protein n=1 Tax=Stieleria mannarensis TaxID=2755585 RepID=UPI001601BA50|nr:hypothetical protein [Rhodopirellula sp. JC639]
MSIHLVLLICAWIRGVIWGTVGDPTEVLPWATEDTVEPGWQGGMKSAKELFGLYAFSLGAIPLVLSIMGATAGFVLGSSLRRRVADDSKVVPPTAKASIIRSVLVCAAAAYLGDSFARVLIFSSLGPMGWSGSGSLLWLRETLGALVWGTIAASAYIRHRNRKSGAAISAGIVGIGVSLLLMRVNYIALPPGLTLGSVLLLVYVAATNKGWSKTTSKASSISNNANKAERPPVKSDGANGLAVFLFGGFSFYAVVCLLTLLAVMGNRNTDNWGVFMPIVIGVWGIPIFGTVAAILHAWTGPWEWLSNGRARRSASYAFLICLLLWVLIITSQ